MVFVNTNDLKHILDQILIAEQHAAGTPLTDLIANPSLSLGLRLVDGTLNNLTEGRETWGSADQIMPRLLDSTFLTQPAEAHLADANPRAPLAGQTSYLQTGGSVYDADPRIISNLVADQTLANPAAIAAMLSHNGMTGQAMLSVANEISTAYRALRDAQAATTNVDAAIALQRAALEAAVTSAQQAHDAAVADVASLTTASATANQDVTDAQTALADASAALVALQNAGDLGAAQVSMDLAQAALVTAQEGLTAAQANLATAEGVAAAALTARDAAQAEVTRLEGESVTAADALSSAQTTLSEAQATLAGMTAPTGLEDARAAVTEAEGLVTSAQAAVDDVATRLETARTQLADLNAQLVTAEASVITAQSSLTTAQQTAAATQATLDTAQATYNTEVTEAATAQSAFMAAFTLFVANPATNFAQMSTAAALWSAARAELDAADAALTRATTADTAADIAAASAQTILTTAQNLVSSLTTQRDTASGAITSLTNEQTTAAENLVTAQTNLSTARTTLADAELDSAAYIAAQGAVETAQAAVDLAQTAANDAAGAVTAAETELSGLETALTEADAEVTRLSGLVGTAEAGVTTATSNVSTAQAELTAAQAASTDMITAMSAVANATLAVQGALTAAELASGNLTAALATEAQAQTSLATANADLAAVDALDATAAAEAAVLTAQTALDTLLTTHAIELDGNNLRLPDVTPDEGLSAPYNSWMTLFGQFFDHGLDLIGKGGSGTVYIPLQPDDPLYDANSPTNFMVLTRATNQPGPDGILGTADDVREHFNKTTPWVDQNQTYTSHPSHQVFLREYVLNDGVPMATGHLLDGAGGGMSTWGDVKAQARDLLGINLSDSDVLDGPLLATDPYGNFIPGPNGLPQLVVANPDFGVVEGAPEHILVEGDLANPVDTTQALRNGHAFLEDIAHNAFPSGMIDHDRNPGTPMIEVTPDADTETGNAIIPNRFGMNETYDNELLDRHYIAGDGRGNENFGLTAVHHIFHSEHNRQVDEMKQTILASGELAFINEWLVAPIAEEDIATATPAALSWDGERLFQAAKFPTEMQYQHLAFEEFGRRVQPQI
ncbi:MAG: heme peroxidase, partial [Paracoccaceae bacterium]|nr:heme peroxidase [Paracoccaceae bacterium]